MAEKDPQKLAAARRMLKEYQKKSKENASSQPSAQQQSLPSNISTQNYVYDSGTEDNPKITASTLNLKEAITTKDDVYHNSNGNHSISNGISESDQSGNINLERICNERNAFIPMYNPFQNAITETNVNASSDINISNSNIKSAKDFFNSLPVSSQSSIDFSFDAPMVSEIPASSVFESNSKLSVNSPTIDTASEVPSSLIDITKNTAFSSNNNDSQSDRSESVPLTPSEHDKSDDISSSSLGQSPKHVSKVLELQLKEVDMKLGIEINKNKILSEQLQQSRNHISQLEETIEMKQNENDAKIAALEEKLQLHVKTLEILVSEKTELQTTLTTCQESISQKAGEIEELQGRLRASRHKVGDLERELGLTKALRKQQEKTAHEATLSKDVLKKEVDLMRKHLDESLEEVLDLKHKLEERGKEIVSLNSDLKEKDSQLSVSQLRIEQLSSSGDGIDAHSQTNELITMLQNDKTNLERQIEELNKNLKTVTTERDEASSQCQQYVTSLNTQLQTMAAKYENVCNQCDNLTTREANLVEHISSLEKQLQQTLPRKHSPPPTTAAITSLQQQNAELLQYKQQFLDVSSEKKQLEEELSLKLSEEEKLNVALEEYSLRVKDLERQIERLEADRPDSNLLQAAIESDKIAASRAIAQNTELKTQLQELQDAFIKLSNNKLELTEQLEFEQNHCKELSKQLTDISASNKEHEEACNVEKTDFCSQTYNVKDCDMTDITIDLEAMAKLEDKFKRKMLEVAELSDEKQRLEHLVLQLQGETETIGEYITLYQIQRGMLRQRAQEKDEQMAKLSQEREVLRSKLNELNHLVTTLLPDSYNHCGITPLGTNKLNSEVERCVEVVETPVEESPTEDTELVNKVGLNKEETAGKIRALLTEIGSNKLVTSDGDAPNFHPCPWCSGRLITV